MLQKLALIGVVLGLAGCVTSGDLDIPLSSAAKVRAIGIQPDYAGLKWEQKIVLEIDRKCEAPIVMNVILATMGDTGGVKSLGMPLTPQTPEIYREYLVPAGKPLRIDLDSSHESTYCHGDDFVFTPRAGAMYEVSMSVLPGDPERAIEMRKGYNRTCIPTVFELHPSGSGKATRTPVKYEVCKYKPGPATDNPR